MLKWLVVFVLLLTPGRHISPLHCNGLFPCHFIFGPRYEVQLVQSFQYDVLRGAIHTPV